MAKRMTIIGGGPGGYTAAFAAAQAGAKVTLIEAVHLGGTCLGTGCIPTKTLKASADALDLARRFTEFGLVGGGEARADMPAIVARKNKVVGILRGGLEKTCAKHKITRLHGRGEVVSASLTRVHLADGSVQEVSGDQVIIATGSGILDLPSLPVDHEGIITSDDALNLTAIPGRLLIVGGGVIGCELAFIFQALGAKVTVVEGLDRVLPLPSMDLDLSKLVQREMKKRGIGCILAQVATAAQMTEHGVSVTLGPSPLLGTLPASARQEATIEVDTVLVAVGRVPNTAGLGLGAAGVETDARGWIMVNECLETSVPGIYAVGDILGPTRIMLAHVAAMEGLVAVKNCLGQPQTMDYGVVPSAVFTMPEVASVGLTEAQARALGLNITCGQSTVRELGKAQAMGELAGIFKLVVDATTGKLLGAHLAGAHASDLVAEAALALQLGATAQDLAQTIHAHPTLAEGLFETARLF